MMGHLIDKARIKQPSLVVSLLDLKRAFGKVHHKLIPTILANHQIPSELQSLISSLYLDFRTCIITDKSSPRHIAR